MPIFTPEQHAQYATEGFFTVEGFFSPEEVAVLQDEIERFKREGLLRNVSTDGDGQTTSATKRNLQLCPTHPHSPRFKALPFSDKVRAAASELLGEPVRLLLDQVFLKPARDGAGTNWHQDNAYFGLQNPMMGLGMWIAVHDATVENGTMHMAPGMWSKALEHVRDGDSDHHIRCFVDESREVPCVMKAGGVAFFCYGTPHCTKGNRTDKDRAGLAYHFYNAEHSPRGFDSASTPLLEGYGETEYGESQRGKWDALVREFNAVAA